MRKRIDWGVVLAAVTAKGLTQVETARRCGMTQPAVSRLAAGLTREPPFSSGEAILRLFKEVCPGQDVPEHATEPATAGQG